MGLLEAEPKPKPKPQTVKLDESSGGASESASSKPRRRKKRGNKGSGSPQLSPSRSLPSLPALKPSPEELAAEADAAQAKFLAPREVGAGGGALTKSERALPV